MDEAQESGGLDGVGSPEPKVDCPETVRDGHGLRHEAVALTIYEGKYAGEAKELFRN